MGIRRRLTQALPRLRRPAPSPVELHLRALLERIEIDCVVDVGAHVGDYGRLLRSLGYQGRIVSFEPVEANARVLRERADERWLVVQKAVGSESGQQTIRLTGGSQQHSFLAPSGYGTRLKPRLFEPAGEATVEVVRLDEVFEELVGPGRSVLLKVDTQGWDFEVLKGAEVSLERVVALQIELALRHTYEGQPDYLALLAWLRERSFEPTGIFPFFFDKEGFVVEAECFLRPRDERA